MATGSQLQADIVFGEAVETFLQSDIGKYLVSRAEADVEAAVEQLKRVAPEQATQIRALQNQIHVAESVMYWLADAIQAGRNAESEMIEAQD
jgi:hypothetical protein